MARRGEEGDNVHISGYTPSDVAFFTRLANEAAEAGIKRAFTAMGLNPEQPFVSQQLFQVLRKIAEDHDDEDARLDAAFVRRWRKMIDGIVGKILAAAAGLVVVGALRVLWDAFKAAVSTKGGGP